MTSDAKQVAPAASRNREPIREVLARELPARGRVLEIASGSGEHAIHFARAFPAVVWQPSDPSDVARASIAAWRAEAGLANLEPPLAIDVMQDGWHAALGTVDAVVCINMVHISPWQATLGLFAGAGRLLAPGALLYLYGPYRFAGVTAESNLEFDRSLKARDPRWGVRDVDELTAAANGNGLALRETIVMPANNHSLVFRRAA
jgi:SAM-dependent methyltransferase